MCWCPAAYGFSEGCWQAPPWPPGLGHQPAGSGKVSAGSWWPPRVEEKKRSLLLSAPMRPSLPFLRAILKRRRYLRWVNASSFLPDPDFITLIFHSSWVSSWVVAGRGARGMKIGEKGCLFRSRIETCPRVQKSVLLRAWQCRRHKRHGFDPWIGKILWRKVWQFTPVLLTGEYFGQRSLARCGP